MSASYCADIEGWGPTSHLRPDLTPCLENTIFLGLPALIAILSFPYRAYSLRQRKQPHQLGRINAVYWPTQVLMFSSSVALIVRAVQLGQDASSAPATMFATVSMAIGWLTAVLLNHFEHIYEIRSSSSIYAFYFITLIASAMNIRTMSMLDQSSQPQFISFVVYFGLNLLGFLVEAFPRDWSAVQKNSGLGNYARANLGSRLSFQYLQPIMSKGFKAPLTAKDIKDLMPEHIRTEHCFPRLANHWEKALARNAAKGKKEPPSLFWVVLGCYKWEIGPVMAYRMAASALTYVSPQLMSETLAFLNTYQTENPAPVSLGIILAFGLFLASIASTFCMAQYFQLSMNIGIEARTALINMIYRKSLRLSPSARQKSSPGSISNHASVDAERWPDAVTFLPMFISIPFELAIAIWMLYQQIGWSVFAGIAAMLMVMPLQGYMAKFFGSAKKAKLSAMDSRIKLMNEVLSSMKTMKLYGWEQSFQKKILYYRNLELETLRRIGVVFSFMSIMFSAMPLIISLVSFCVYATVGGPNFTPGVINAQVIFVSVSLFALLNRPIGMLAHIIAEALSVWVSTKRISAFLRAEELDENDVLVVREMPKDPLEPIIAVKDGVFAWVKESADIETEKQKLAREKEADRKQKEAEQEAIKLGKPIPVRVAEVEQDFSPTLVNINLSIQRGQLTAVVGRVGQGKSSLLNALIGDMYRRQGSVKVYGRMAYVAQQAWITNATLKENIVFGNTFDQAKYDHIIHACGLIPDIAMLPAGDMTEIGERGINLSGGQKQRVSLARAAYEDADVYLFDDPLSAVDAHVDQHLWSNLIGPDGLLKDKTRVLVTHAIHHLDQVDHIVVIKDGTVDETGKYDDLMSAQNAFYNLIKDYSVNQGKGSRTKKRDATSLVTSPSESNIDTEIESTVGSESDDGQVVFDEKTGKEVTTKKKDDGAIVKTNENGELVAEEKMELGSVGLYVYKIYMKAASYKLSILVISLFVIAQGCQIGTNLWLTYWTNHVETLTIGEFLGVYTAIVLMYVVLNVVVAYVMMVIAAIRASSILHKKLLTKMMRLPMGFYDTTPLGRVVNRFSSDIFALDETLPWNVVNVLVCAVSVLGTIVVIGTSTPIFLALMPPLIICYFVIQEYYIRSSRALKRIDSVSKSPIYQHITESLNGCSTIRALGAQEKFTKENASKADLAANAYFSWVSGNRWLQIRLETLSALIVLAAALFAVLGRDTINASVAGLSLSYALSASQDITWLVRSYTDLQNQLVCVERIEQYANKNPEAPATTPADQQLPENWPQNGKIEFRHYSTRYRQGLDLVVKDLNFTVDASEKVGIVGRTGAGKSSLTLALFRIIEAANSHWAQASHNGEDADADKSKTDVADLEKIQIEEDGGSIWIDDIDISTVGLEYLRQHLAIIPQDPVLFEGTVRDNLDPFSELQDADLWEALERAHLKDYVTSLAGGLQFKVSSNGENFSIGQRSLLCLARALLRKTKILILDEATSAVDVETDELIQKTIRSEFKDRTILTIAHRIRTVMDSDKILVLEKGRVEEFESPATLLQNKDSLFYKLADQSGEIKHSDGVA